MDELNNQEEPAMASNVLRKVWLITGAFCSHEEKHVKETQIQISQAHRRD